MADTVSSREDEAPAQTGQGGETSSSPERYGPTPCSSEIMLSVLSNILTFDEPAIYSPITAKDGFRILCLFALPEPAGLSGILIDQVIGDSMPYDCLSYTWGSSENQSFIQLRDFRLPITGNLDNALRTIRGKIDPSSAIAMLWVDAICINQADEQERNQQVPQMRKIYSNAQQVLAYLGPQADGSETLPHFFMSILDSYAAHEGPTEPNHVPQGDQKVWDHVIRPHQYQELGLPARSDPAWQRWVAFASRPWFRRAWIIQEAAVAKKLIFICGHWVLPEWILHFIITKTCQYLIDFPGDAVKYCSLMAYVHPKNQPLQLLSLIDLVKEIDYAEATDPRDHINALLGICEEFEEEELQPRYDQSVAKTFIRFGNFAIRNGHGAKLLFMACAYEGDLQIPSWVPNLGGAGRTISLERPQTSVKSRRKGEKPYAAAGGSLQGMRLGKAGELLAQSIWIGRIRELGMSSSALQKSDPWTDLVKDAGSDAGLAQTMDLRITTNFLSDITTYLEAIYTSATKKERDEMLWRIAVLNEQVGSGYEAGFDERATFQAFRLIRAWHLASLMGEPEMAHELLPDMEGTRYFEFLSDDMLTVEMFQDPSRRMALLATKTTRFMDQVISIAVNTVPCRVGGKFLGMVPRDAAVGDVVFVMLGATTPYVLRPADDAYTLIGPCYIHGLMKGEALGMHHLERETIRIK